MLLRACGAPPMTHPLRKSQWECSKMKLLSRLRRFARRESRGAKGPTRRADRRLRVEPLEDRRLLAVIFDNGPTDAARPTWNATHPGYTTFDDFDLTEATTLQAIEYDAFQGHRSDYVQTRLSIFDAVDGTRVAPDFTGTAALARNGLRTSNSVAPVGFTHHLEGLSVSLDPGRYFVGISLENVPDTVASIGSGPGSEDTIGPGLYQRLPHQSWVLRAADHMAFQLIAPDAPPVAHDDFVSTPEDSGTLVSVAANDEHVTGALDATSVIATTDPANGSLTNHGDGTFTYLPDADFHGTDTFGYSIADFSGQVDTAEVTVTVTSVNDAPSFHVSPDHEIDEDASPQTVQGWVTEISPGPPNESAQHVSFYVSSDNEGLFLAPPAISDTGTLTYTPAPNAFGAAQVTLHAVDDGGTAGGGRDTSPPQTFTITVHPVIDAAVDVKPGEDPNTINVRSRGRLSIAVLSTQIANGELDDVDATTTDLSSLSLNATDVDAVHAAFEDVDGDGDDDLILHFRVPDLVDRDVLNADTVDLVLAAEFGRGEASGTELSGSDAVRTTHADGGKGKGKR